MIRYLARRAIGGAATIAGVVVAVFLLLAAAPGDPARLTLLGQGPMKAASPEAVQAFRERHGLDQPLPRRLAAWTLGAARLDLGRSFRDGRPVTERIAETLPPTLLANLAALLLALVVAVPAGIVAAYRPGGAFDRTAGFVLDALYSLPAFALGLLLLLLFAVQLRWVPVFADAAAGPRGLALPVATLALVALAPIARVTRAAVGDALRSSPALSARARGESTREEVLRALRRALPSFAALGATLVPQLVAGSVLVERVFGLPGTGQLLADSVFARDLPTVLGLTLVSAVAVVGASFAGDVAAALADARLRSPEEP